MLRALIAVIFLGLWPVSMLAQDVAYVQVEAHPTLTTAQARARFYAGQLENVNGFSLGGGWYGVVLGPYTPDDANTVLRQMRRDRTIPSDSFIITGRRFLQQFWPVGVGAQTTAQPLPDATTPEVETVAPIEAAPLAEVIELVAPPTETRRQAQASEKLLDRDQRKDLQTALKWAGFYASAIDGAYGRGTRASMRAWQDANNAEPTGVLTTTQRATLLTSYNAVLDGMDLQLVRDDASGIEMLVPTGVVVFAEYEPPFVRFDRWSQLVDATHALKRSAG
ncbi:MAG: peptidoglycan-binding domain-containing protein, partial [Yoonia sp.]|nr:peptidoglycan-binding domain-containing protein [Yoonia sp.]